MKARSATKQPQCRKHRLEWQGEHDMEVGHREQLGFAIGEPFPRRRALMWWTAPAPDVP
jgi:hypothetical protein